MMNIGVNGIGEVVMTLKANGVIKVGDLVTISANSTAQKAVADAEPIGVCVSTNAGYVGIQLKGGMVIPCEDSTLTTGLRALKVTATGGVAKAATGTTRLVTAVDAVKKTADVIF